MDALIDKARTFGIDPTWWDVQGHEHQVPQATLEFLVKSMEAAGPPTRTHLAVPGDPAFIEGAAIGEPCRLVGEDGTSSAMRTVELDGRPILSERPAMGLYAVEFEDRREWLIVSPVRCLDPSDFGIDRCFGVTAQLYSLKGGKPSDMGDFGTLAEAAPLLAAEGADFIGLNPLHALFTADPSTCSPYSPSSRRFINPLYIDVDEAARELGLEAPPASPPANGELIDYSAAGARRMARLRALYSAFHDRGGDHGFERFSASAGRAMREHALFEVLHGDAIADDPDTWAFWTWPEDRACGGKTARAVAEERSEEVRFHLFLQWLADGQLKAAQEAARGAGMRIGLYRDLAVGVNPAGSMVWSHPGLALRGVSIGAPPDWFSPLGQVWGLAPMAPNALAHQGYRPLLDDLDANARHAGALRIDHVIGLARQFWVPEGKTAAEGAYVNFPFDVIVRLATLVSHRHRCLIIGEDLGTVPEGFRDRLQYYNLLSCRLVWFEREGERPCPPDHYPPAALASISTHDLPTVRGFIEGRDIDWRDRLDLFPDHDAAAAAKAERKTDIARFETATREFGIEDQPIDLGLHRLLARTRSRLAAVQIEDLDGAVEQPNLPGTIDTHPNWRRRISQPLKSVLKSGTAQDILAIMREERPG